jgi:ABC-type multidrug transport system fused ATPase/permease subunit
LRSVSKVLKKSRDGQQDYSGLTRKLLELARPYRRPLALVLGLQLCAALLESLGASLVVPLMQIMVTGSLEQASLPLGVLGKWSSWLLGQSSFASQLRNLALLFLAVGLARSAVHYISTLAANRFTLSVSADLRKRLLQLYLRAEYQFFLDRRQGRMLNDLSDEPGRAAGALSRFLDWGQQLLYVAGLTLVLMSISWQATAIAGALGIGMAIGMERLRLRAAVLGKEGLINNRQLGALVAEVLSGIRQIKLFGAEKRVSQSHDVVVGNAVRLGLRSLRLSLLPGIVSRVTGVLIIGGVLFGLSLLSPAEARVLLPALGAFVFVSARLLPLVSDLSTQRIKLFSSAATLQFVIDSLKDSDGEPELRENSLARQFQGFRDRIEFERVTFAYRRSRQADTLPTQGSWLTSYFETPGSASTGEVAPQVLQDVSLVFRSGYRTAIVGPSGGGKSTVVDLLARLFDPDEGRIAVDGMDVREYGLNSWRAHIGYVSQDTFIFHGTIRENIAFANPEASLADVEEAARLANAHEFVVELPGGYDTVVGDRGLKLSGGQRQRVAIARAILRDPPILIFDEATSSLDSVAERAVQAGIETASQDRTVIVIAHRLSTVMNADWIYVLDHGRVSESGRHADLLSRNGVYRELYVSTLPAEEHPVPYRE